MRSFSPFLILRAATRATSYLTLSPGAGRRSESEATDRVGGRTPVVGEAPQGGGQGAGREPGRLRRGPPEPPGLPGAGEHGPGELEGPAEEPAAARPRRSYPTRSPARTGRTAAPRRR